MSQVEKKGEDLLIKCFTSGVEDLIMTDLWFVELSKSVELMKEDTGCFVETIKAQSFDLYQFNYYTCSLLRVQRIT